MGVPQTLKSTCILGAVYSPEIGSVAGSYAKSKLSPDPTRMVSLNYYHAQQNENNLSSTLSPVAQASGGIMCAVNKNIGATLNTFLYGSLKPGEKSNLLNLIKGPDITTNFSFPNPVVDTNSSAISASYTYNPSSFIDDAVITSVENDSIYNPQNVSSIGGVEGYMTIPSVANNSRFPDAPVLTTWNIWQPMLLPKKVKFQKDYGIIYPNLSDYTPDELLIKDQFLFARQTKGQNSDDLGIICSAQNNLYAITRSFPIGADLAYQYKSMNHQPKIYNSNNSSGKNKIFSREIKAQGTYNCGFQLHFDTPVVNKQSFESNTDWDGITIAFGSGETTSARKGIIDNFNIVLRPGRIPILLYYNPIQKSWISFKLDGEEFGKTNRYSVYVHFAGPIMLIGFSDNIQEWNAFNPIEEFNGYDTVRLYPQIPPTANITLYLKNIYTRFQYGAIAFSNFDKFGNGELDTDKIYNSKLKTQFLLPKRNDALDVQEIKYGFFEGRLLNPNFKDPADIVKNPTYYSDWRRINSIDPRTDSVDPELYWVSDDITLLPASNSKDFSEKQFLLEGKILWDTTIEGPIFFNLSVDRKIKNSNDDLVKNFKWGDISDYLTDWNIGYSFGGTDGNGNHTYLNCDCDITLKNLETTKFGRNVLNVIRGNQLAVTIGAGVDETENFFQGIIIKEETSYTATGSITKLKCKDIMSHILDTSRFKNYYTFNGVGFLHAIESCVKSAGLKKWYYTDNNTNFLNGLANIKMGVNFAVSPGTVQEIAANLDTKISEIVKIILEKAISVETSPVFFWDAKLKQLKLQWRFNPDYVDDITFFGDIDNNSLLPDDIHGVITDGGYTLSSDLESIFTQIMLQSMTYNALPIVFKKNFEESIALSTLNKLNNAVSEDTETVQPDLFYIGWNKPYISDVAPLQIKTQTDLDSRGFQIITNYRKIYQDIKFSVYVTKPLNPQGCFRINTFLKPDESATDSDGNTIYTTTPYSYSSIRYSYSKNKNTIIADIQGETIPPWFEEGYYNA